MSQSVGAPGQTASSVELRSALEDALSSFFGGRRCIATLERRPCAYRSSFAIEELEVRLDDGATLQVIFKDLSRQALLEDARQSKPAFLFDPLREIETYRRVLSVQALGTAACYGAVVDHRVGRYWLFLEKVPGALLWQADQFATWEQVARWLAILHTRLAPEAKELAQAAHLLHYDGDFYRLWLERARAFSCQLPQAPLAGSRLEWLASGYEGIVERLEAMPVTLIHGEFYPSNVLVDETATELRICPVDWEMAALGPGLIDLAALTAGTWNEEERVALAMAYHAELRAEGDSPADREAFLAALDCCRLHLAMQWLGWSPSWSPPPKHAQDWLSQAVRLGEKLGVN